MRLPQPARGGLELVVGQALDLGARVEPTSSISAAVRSLASSFAVSVIGAHTSRSSGFRLEPLPAKSGEAKTGKADHHHRPRRRFRDAGHRSDLYRGIRRKPPAIGQEVDSAPEFSTQAMNQVTGIAPP